MIKLICAVFCLLLITSIAPGQSTSKRLIVKFRQDISYSIDYLHHQVNSSNKAVDSILAGTRPLKIQSLIYPGQHVPLSIQSIELVKNIHFIELRNAVPFAALQSKLMQSGLFEYVLEDNIAKGAGEKSCTTGDPNDTYFGRQWALKNNGTFNTSALANADINMDNAWSVTTGDAATIVCILDGGVKMDHPEFAGRIWTNPHEIPNNNIDDDNNGYIDDVNGWDWVNLDNDPTDDYGHGTNVAGIIGANSNNGNGYAGVNWNCKLMIGKVLDNSDLGFYSWIISGINYAVLNGAKVINTSLGGTVYNQALDDACWFAYYNNVVLVASMGNTNSGEINYPAGHGGAIAVGATTTNDHRAVPFPWSGTSGSNYGNHIDVVAPGDFIYGLDYTSNSNYNIAWSGTSQAVPYVSGIASLLFAVRPTLTAAQVRTILRTSANDLVGDPSEDTPGFDQYMGYGRVNAMAALTSNLLPLQMGLLTGTVQQQTVTLSWKTFNEVSINRFDIEKNENNSSWQYCGTVPARGNNNGEASYSFTNRATQTGTILYRLRIVEDDGQFHYSTVYKATVTADRPILVSAKVMGNELRIAVNSEKPVVIHCVIYNSTGQAVIGQNMSFSKGYSESSLDIQTLPHGFYILQGTGDRHQVLFTKKTSW